jgi:histidine triad (HIT) family protein
VQTLPEDKKAEAMKQIEEMSDGAIEKMLAQQKSRSQAIFRMIIEGEIPAVKIAENSHALAVLSTRSLSEGHSLIIPKEPVKDAAKIPKEALALAESLSKKITENLKAKSIKMETQFAFGEAVIHLIPIYKENISLDSPQFEMTRDDLEKVKKKLEIIKIEKKVEKITKPKKPKVKKSEIIRLPRRIP